MGSDDDGSFTFLHVLLNFTVILAHVLKQAWWEAGSLLSALLYELLVSM